MVMVFKIPQIHQVRFGTDLLNVLELESTLVDGRVRNIVAFGVLKHQRQI